MHQAIKHKGEKMKRIRLTLVGSLILQFLAYIAIIGAAILSFVTIVATWNFSTRVAIIIAIIIIFVMIIALFIATKHFYDLYYEVNTKSSIDEKNRDEKIVRYMNENETLKKSNKFYRIKNDELEKRNKELIDIFVENKNRTHVTKDREERINQYRDPIKKVKSEHEKSELEDKKNRDMARKLRLIYQTMYLLTAIICGIIAFVLLIKIVNSTSDNEKFLYTQTFATTVAAIVAILSGIAANRIKPNDIPDNKLYYEVRNCFLNIELQLNALDTYKDVSDVEFNKKMRIFVDKATKEVKELNKSIRDVRSIE
jgi:ABC-type multidrug transport system fused ATPase/permease subunit